MTKRYLFIVFREATDFKVGAVDVKYLIPPGKIVLIILLALIGSRLLARLIRRSILSLGTHTPIQARSDRAGKRARALASTAAGISRVIVWTIAVALILSVIGLNLGPFVAGATIIGAALGFGAQSLVKDVLAGFMILTEDQYAVGDTIALRDTTGTVEDVNLLRTRVRADDGKVWFVANGEIRSVANGSLGWARATVDLVLPYEADMEAAVSAASAEAGAMAQEPEWEDAILAPPEAYRAGVRVDGCTLRVTAKTRPAVSFAVGRALLDRVDRRVRNGVPGGGGGSGAVRGSGPRGPCAPGGPSDPPPE